MDNLCIVCYTKRFCITLKNEMNDEQYIKMCIPCINRGKRKCFKCEELFEDDNNIDFVLKSEIYYSFCDKCVKSYYEKVEDVKNNVQ
jgi:hypothetical protein